MGCEIRRIIQFKEAVVYQSINILNQMDQDITANCMYSWSTDSVCWTNWVNYNTYIKLAKNLESDFYLRILITDSLKSVSLNNLINNWNKAPFRLFTSFFHN